METRLSCKLGSESSTVFKSEHSRMVSTKKVSAALKIPMQGTKMWGKKNTIQVLKSIHTTIHCTHIYLAPPQTPQASPLHTI